MKTLYAVLAGAILALGVVHMATTFRLSSSPASKVWFFSGGIVLVLDGLLNFLNRRYGPGAFGLRAVCICTNVFMLCFTTISGGITGGSLGVRIVMAAVMALTLLLSILRSASISTQPPAA